MIQPPLLKMFKILFSAVRLMIELAFSLFNADYPKYKRLLRILESIGGLISAPSGNSFSLLPPEGLGLG